MSDRPSMFRGTYGQGSETWNGTEAAYVGTAPTAGARKIRKEFTAAVTADAGGIATITYPGGAFPNGIVSVVATPGDNSASLGYFQVPLSPQTLSVLTLYPRRADALLAVVSAAIRANVIAVGW